MGGDVLFTDRTHKLCCQMQFGKVRRCSPFQAAPLSSEYPVQRKEERASSATRRQLLLCRQCWIPSAAVLSVVKAAWCSGVSLNPEHSNLAACVLTPAVPVWQVDGVQSPLLQRPDTISGTIFRLPAGFRDGDPLPSVRH